MNLRMLRKTDAPLMLEWMHDDNVVHDFKTDFSVKTLEDCVTFICLAQETTSNLHLAIVDDNDTYLGTVSLKHITKSSAEFGIVVRKCAIGKGYAQFAMLNIFNMGFKQLGLQRIYWCVSPKNIRAVRFYEKNGYNGIIVPKEAKDHYSLQELQQFIWYETVNNDIKKNINL